jgi:hypothetical protein
MPTPFSRGPEGRRRRVVLPRVLADRGTHDDLEDLILAEARRSRHGEATLSIKVLSGSLKPAFSNAARAGDTVPSPSRIRATSALRPCLISDLVVP